MTDAAEPFGICLNTSTRKGQGLSLEGIIDVAAEAGYRGVEPWVREIDEFVAAGGALADLRREAKERMFAV